jgi:polyhydroxyalkanoate synthesis regulator phasin/predicted transcriptional regulator
MADHIDQKIKSVLKYGKKRQVEIIELVDVNRNTVRSHLEKLVEQGDLLEEKQGNAKYYYSEDAGERIIQPKPYADAAEVKDVLHDLNTELQGGTKSHGIISRITNRGTDQSRGNQDETSLDLLTEFYDVSNNNYYLLENRENLDLFFSVFDKFLETLQGAEPQNKILVQPEIEFRILFMTATDLYDNWTKGKENEDYHKLMLERTNDMQSAIGYSEEIDRTLQSLLISISRDEGKKAYISMVRSGNYSVKTLVEDAFYIYDAENEIHELFSDLENAEKMSNENTKAEITKLRRKIRQNYNRFARD